MRVPTQDEVDRAFAEQEARDYQRFLAKRAGQRPPDNRDAAVELAKDLPKTTPVVDVNTAPLRPPLVSPPNPVKNEAFCKYCGKLFKAKTVGMAKMQKSRHEKKEHAGESATAA